MACQPDAQFIVCVSQIAGFGTKKTTYRPLLLHPNRARRDVWLLRAPTTSPGARDRRPDGDHGSGLDGFPKCDTTLKSEVEHVTAPAGDPVSRVRADVAPTGTYRPGAPVWVYREARWRPGVVDATSELAARVTYLRASGTGVDEVTAPFLARRDEVDAQLDRCVRRHASPQRVPAAGGAANNAAAATAVPA